MTELSAERTQQLRETCAEWVYEAYRLGKFSTVEHLPMWHEDGCNQRPMYEALHLTAALAPLIAGWVAAAEQAAARKAWDEGWLTGADHHSDWNNTTHANPYDPSNRRQGNESLELPHDPRSH
jgi:hypothetical protein